MAPLPASDLLKLKWGEGCWIPQEDVGSWVWMSWMSPPTAMEAYIHWATTALNH